MTFYFFFNLTDYVISGESHNDEWFPVKNVLTWSIPEVRLGLHGDIGANYWLAPLGTQSHFILKFDQPRTVDTITLVNTFNGDVWRNSGTNEFKVRAKSEWKIPPILF